MEGLTYLFIADEPEPLATLLPATHANFAITCIMIVIGLVAAACLLRWTAHAKVRISTILWGLVFVAALVALRQLCDLKMVYCPAEVYGAACVIAVVGGIACALRDVLFDFQSLSDEQGLQKVAGLSRGARDILALMGSAVMCTVAIEIPWNASILPENPLGVIVEMVVTLGVLLFLYFAFMRHGIGPALGVLACLALGEAQYFVTQFRGSSLVPSDLLAMQTAAAVGSGYAYELRTGAVWAIAWALGALCLLVFVQPRHVKGQRHLWRIGGSAACALAVALVGVACFHAIDFKNDLGFRSGNWHPLALYKNYCNDGFIPMFVGTAQRMDVQAPEGYRQKTAQEEQARLAQQGSQVLARDEGYAQASQQFQAEQPHVVVVMNESFSDLSIFDGLRVGYQGPEFFNQRFAPTLVRGLLSVSVLGGGTANSEFEFLSSTTLAAAGSSVSPYDVYRFENVPTLVSTFKDLGYDATAIHPGAAVNWHRNLVYPAMGFDEFIDLESFKDVPNIRWLPKDATTYDKVLEILQQADGPQFIFDVTIQNHGGYNFADIPEDLRLDYHLDAVGLGSVASETNAFLSLMRSSDVDLEAFIAQLSALDQKVVLVFFGDHQPGISGTLNATIFPDEDQKSFVHAQRTYESVYAVWANYDIAGRENGFAGTLHTSASSLASVALQAVGGPFDEVALAKLAIRQDIPAANVFAYLGANGQWYIWDDEASPYFEMARQLRDIEYLNFGSVVG